MDDRLLGLEAFQIILDIAYQYYLTLKLSKYLNRPLNSSDYLFAKEGKFIVYTSRIYTSHLQEALKFM